MKKLTNRTDFIGLVIVFILFMGATIGGLVLHVQNQRMAGEQQQKRKQLLSLENSIRSVQNSIAQTKESGIENTPETNMEQVRPEEWIEGLKRLAESHNLRVLESELYSKTIALRNYPKYQVTQWKMEIYGDYSGLIGFLEELPYNRSIVRLSTFKVVSEYRRLENTTEVGYQLKVRLILDLISGASIK